MRSDKFGSQLDRKSKTWFFTFLNVYATGNKRDKILISQLTPPKFRYFADRNGRKEGPMKLNFDNFLIQKYHKQLELRNWMKKKWVHLSNFLFSFLRFLAELAQICKKCTILDNLRIITQEGDMKTRLMTPFFSSGFRALTV